MKKEKEQLAQQETAAAPKNDKDLMLAIIAGMEEKRLKQSENNVKIAKIFAICIVFCCLIVCGTVLAFNFTYEDDVIENISVDQTAGNGSSNSIQNANIGGGEQWLQPKE